MRFSALLCIFLTIAGCSSPGGRYREIEPVFVTVESSEFDIYILGDEVRAIRTSFEVLPRIQVIGPRAVIAMERATGCEVVDGSFTGDQAMADARVSC
ncbi:hypothetical protein A9Q96_07585 [Rhodobacterales bacterium 52_120_T64]|nr:hypothetical protein A9Q96_07585 [Rhodobacterales bacterium 52_120_T64]